MLGDSIQGIPLTCHWQSRDDVPNVSKGKSWSEILSPPSTPLHSPVLMTFSRRGSEPGRLSCIPVPACTTPSVCSGSFLRPPSQYWNLTLSPQRSPCPHPALGMDIPHIPRSSLALANPGFLLASVPLSETNSGPLVSVLGLAQGSKGPQ